jgi:hypothetical protein
MAFSRRLGVVSILGACWFVAVGCGDDEDRKTSTEDGGEGGEGTGTSGSGGKSSIGGNQSTAGNAGKGGTTAGSAGSGNNAGEGGSGFGGDAGGGGIVAGAGGETPGGAGEGGGATTGGAGGEGGAPEPVAAMCKYQCDGNEDCTFADAVPHKCDLTTGSCEQCLVDEHCLAELSIWVVPCEDDSGCTPDFEACVAADGVGYCASLPDANTPEFPCPTGIPQTLPRFGAQGNVEVCAADARCLHGICDYGCRDPFSAGCGIGTGDTCSPTTGLCECAQSSECDTGTCGADSHCVECVTAQDCDGGPAAAGRDTCVGGKCGCAGVNSCPNRAYVGNPPKLCE